VALIDEWVDKADADCQGAVALQRLRQAPLPDLVCYHCQQCIEKYLKAYLIAHGETPPRTHDLEQLLKLCTVYDSTLLSQQPLAQALNPFGVLVRYRDLSATLADAQDAIKTMRRLRRVPRRKLGL
jgi:HEPN domain-containing protein